MSESLKKKLARLQEIAPKLNMASDNADALVRVVEKLIGDDLSLGIPAESGPFSILAVRVEDDDEDDADRADRVSFRLVYGPIQGTYRIYVVREGTRAGPDPATDPGDDTERIPWEGCPREIKLEAFLRLPEVLERIADKAQSLEFRARTTTRAVHKLLEAMRPPPRPD